MEASQTLYKCPRCAGTGSLESSDSTDDSWWDCSTCEGTGKLKDRRSPDPQLTKALDVLDKIIDMADRADSPAHSMQGRTNAWANLGDEAVRLAREARGKER